MDWGNAIIKEIVKDENNIITKIHARLHLEGDFKKTDKKVTWLAATDSLVPITTHFFDNLITKDKLEENDNVQDFITPNSATSASGLADANIASMKANDVLQFERKGYYRLDEPYNPATGEPARFFSIPDGSKKDRYGVKEQK
jgi:glutamyl-tRNA synthetase